MPMPPRWTVCVLLCLLLAGCMGIKYTDQPMSAELEPGQAVGTRVLAKAAEWRVSGVNLVRGRTYTVSAQGRWTVGPICGWTGPDGANNSPLCFDGVVRGWSGAALVAKIGDTGKPFGVGGKYTFQAAQDGVLLFKVNDPAHASGDNDGYMDVEVLALAPAAQATAPMQPVMPLPTAAPAKKAAAKPVPVPAPVTALPAPPVEEPSAAPPAVPSAAPTAAAVQPTAPPAQAPAAAARPATPSPGRRVALVIGNGAYPSAPLKNPVNDARDMASALRGLGFEVILRENATLRQMEEGVDELWKRLRAGGSGLFFFAGHGLQVAGRNYLVPVDARLSVEQDVKYRCMDAGLVLGRMENAGNGLNIVILDACRNNPYARSWRSADQGLAKMDAPKGSLIAYSTAPDSVAADGLGRNGIYTGQLLRNLRTPGLGIEELFKRVRIGVLSETGDKQVPWESSSLTGYFTFNADAR